MRTRQDTTVEERVEGCEEEGALLRDDVEFLKRHLTDSANIIESLERRIKRTEVRLASILREVYHCPKCKARVSEVSTFCKGCGHKWGKQPDPDVGKPIK